MSIWAVLLYEKNRYVRRLTQILGFGNSPKDLISSRSIEYPWVLRNLTISHGRVLDVGPTGSTFPILLASFGYDVYFGLRGGFWVRLSSSELVNVDSSVKERAVAMIKASKPTSQ